METAIQVYEGAPPPLALSDVKAQVNLIQQIMREVMQPDQHYGVIPGTSGKPSLLKPGAEKLIMTFRLVPDIEEQVVDLPNEHREYRVKAKLYTQNGIFLGAGVGSCTTMEGKYRYRKADLLCPECGQAAIIKGKEEFGGGWVCYQKKGGCGKKWTDANSPFGGVITSRVEHDNPADYYNTCLKMAKKRALVDACLTVTAASDIFTQDIEDMPEVMPGAAQNQKPNGKPPLTQPKAKTATKPETLSVHGIIDNAETKSGGTNEKPWTKHAITIAGQVFGTFDQKIADLAAQYRGSDVGVSYTVDAKGRQTIVELVPILTGDAPE
jgi:hypothetical protein